jgi:hypothetical protein
MTSPLRIDRRGALKVGIGTGIGSLLGLSASTAEDPSNSPTPAATNQPAAPRTDPLPLIDARFPCEIAEDVWIIPDRRIFLVPNVGIVVGKKAALVIDCGLGPQCGQHVLAAVEKIAPGRQLILTQTHAHPEHAFGAVAFKDRAQIFLNRQQNDYLVKTGSKLLQMFRQRLGEPEKELLEGTEIVPGTDIYDGDQGSLISADDKSSSTPSALPIARETKSFRCRKKKSSLPGTSLKNGCFPLCRSFLPPLQSPTST